MLVGSVAKCMIEKPGKMNLVDALSKLKPAHFFGIPGGTQISLGLIWGHL